MKSWENVPSSKLRRAGAIETDRRKKAVADFARSWSQLTPLRIGTPDDEAASVEFLLSDRPHSSPAGGLFAQLRWPDEDYNP
jgi:hypothetical protein